MIIDFDKKRKLDHHYKEQLKDTGIKLAEISQDLFDGGLMLALSGKWKEWNDSIPVGTTINFNEEMLLDTGDEIVTKLIQLQITVDDLIDDINDKMKI